MSEGAPARPTASCSPEQTAALAAIERHFGKVRVSFGALNVQGSLLCGWCGGDVVVNYSKGRVVFCSATCRRKYGGRTTPRTRVDTRQMRTMLE